MALSASCAKIIFCGTSHTMASTQRNTTCFHRNFVRLIVIPFRTPPHSLNGSRQKFHVQIPVDANRSRMRSNKRGFTYVSLRGHVRTDFASLPATVTASHGARLPRQRRELRRRLLHRRQNNGNLLPAFLQSQKALQGKRRILLHGERSALRRIPSLPA